MNLRNAVLALAFLLVCPIAAHSQTSIQIRDASGAVLATYGSGVVILKASSSVSLTPSSNTVVLSGSGTGSAGNVTINGHTFTATILNINAVLPAAASGFQNGVWAYSDSGLTGEASVSFPFCANGSGHTGGLVPDPTSGGSSGSYLGADCAFHTLPSGSTFYQTVQLSASSATQRAKLNFLSGFSVADNSGNGSTDIGLTGSFVGIHGTPTPGHCAEWFDATTIEDAGSSCGGGGGGGSGNFFIYPPMSGSNNNWPTSTTIFASNAIALYFFPVPYELPTDAGLCIATTNQDSADIGLYDANTLNLVAHTGSVSWTAGGTLLNECEPWSPSSPLDIPAGQYYVAITSNSASPALQITGNNVLVPQRFTTTTTATSGVLPSSIATPTYYPGNHGTFALEVQPIIFIQ